MTADELKEKIVTTGVVNARAFYAANEAVESTEYLEIEIGKLFSLIDDFVSKQTKPTLAYEYGKLEGYKEGARDVLKSIGR